MLEHRVKKEKAGFGSQLHRWRKRRRFTQMDLAFVSGYSQKHLSFLESGRAQPSRETVAALSHALDVPIAARNELYLGAGFAPVYSQEPVDSDSLQPTMSSLQELLAMHRPFPAILVDRVWNLQAANPNALELFTRFTHDPEAVLQAGPINSLRLCLDHAGLRPYMVNWQDFITRLLGNARKSIIADGGSPELHDFVSNMELALSENKPSNQVVSPHTSPVTHLILERGETRLEIAALMSYFDSPFDATIASMRIETFIPVDEITRKYLLDIENQFA